MPVRKLARFANDVQPPGIPQGSPRSTVLESSPAALWLLFISCQPNAQNTQTIPPSSDAIICTFQNKRTIPTMLPEPDH